MGTRLRHVAPCALCVLFIQHTPLCEALVERLCQAPTHIRCMLTLASQASQALLFPPSGCNQACLVPWLLPAAHMRYVVHLVCTHELCLLFQVTPNGPQSLQGLRAAAASPACGGAAGTCGCASKHACWFILWLWCAVEPVTLCDGAICPELQVPGTSLCACSCMHAKNREMVWSNSTTGRCAAAAALEREGGPLCKHAHVLGALCHLSQVRFCFLAAHCSCAATSHDLVHRRTCMLCRLLRCTEYCHTHILVQCQQSMRDQGLYNQLHQYHALLWALLLLQACWSPCWSRQVLLTFNSPMLHAAAG